VNESRRIGPLAMVEPCAMVLGRGDALMRTIDPKMTLGALVNADPDLARDCYAEPPAISMLIPLR
jgi:hypothetical protein